MTPEQYTRKLEITLKVIQIWTACSHCSTCQNIEKKCKEALAKKSETEE